ncbi:hypothetical protein CONPUDRAFT_82069 [Coniophora puteana RWD-64-598 SS2]|uniref:Uncharacterized protein n=1 Tax=Coniophora puteana (strain RWD-64-598) TaxID=741705 RepID=A0A5M3MP59_CONPW|nr:uncharacterized protein CONPUDRAFT_82069 [Coniophora puteana RWD-64-598 SS2]EIW80958.1 hypothetical protein CONPUDRAFT_82069 [Coniophora puteana RWD-64-598 SS2]
MGGRAFLQNPAFTSSSFPRLPPELYFELRDFYLSALKPLYERVEIPAEPPSKADYGDIDFLVLGPIARNASDDGSNHEDIKRALGAVDVLAMSENRTSNYAVPLKRNHHRSCNFASSDGQKYVQVDVHVCASELELRNILLIHGYGDLGMIITATARACGLSIGTKGMKMTSPHPNPPTLLTSSASEAFEFMGLSLSTWEKGFTTQEAIFRFAVTSRFFAFAKLDTSGNHKLGEERTMYGEFLSWARIHATSPGCSKDVEEVKKEALEHFGKKGEWDAMVRDKHEREWLKGHFNGRLVQEWTGLNGRGIKMVMDKIRSDAGGERMLVNKDSAELITLAQEAKAQLYLR